MPRRAQAVKRIISPDPKYKSVMVGRLVNRIMICGKKNTAQKIVYDALDLLEQQESQPPLDIMELAIKNSTLLLEVKARRIGGATYQVPIEVRPDRALSLALRWLVASTRARTGKSMAEKLAAELSAASKGQGETIRRRENTHRMAEANRAFAHFRW